MKMTVLALALTVSSLSFADHYDQRRGDLSSLGTTVYSAITSQDPGAFNKEDVRILVPNAMEVLQGLPASQSFQEAKLLLEKTQGHELSDAEVAKIIIGLAVN